MSFLAFMIPWKDEPLFMPFPLQLSFRDRTASSIPFFQANNQGDHWSLLIFLVWKTCFWNHGFPPFEFLGAVCWEVAGPKRWCLFLHLAEKYPRRCSGEFLPHQSTQRMVNFGGLGLNGLDSDWIPKNEKGLLLRGIPNHQWPSLKQPWFASENGGPPPRKFADSGFGNSSFSGANCRAVSRRVIGGFGGDSRDTPK